jgi:hypothetical protein
MNDTKRAEGEILPGRFTGIGCGVWVASPLRKGRGEKAGVVGFTSQTDNQPTPAASFGAGGCFTCTPLFARNSSWVRVRLSSCTNPESSRDLPVKAFTSAR